MKREILIYGDEDTSILGINSLEIACSKILQLPCKVVDSTYIMSQN